MQVEAAEEERRIIARRVAEGKLRNLETKKENEAIRVQKEEERQRELELLKVHEGPSAAFVSFSRRHCRR